MLTHMTEAQEISADIERLNQFTQLTTFVFEQVEARFFPILKPREWLPIRQDNPGIIRRIIDRIYFRPTHTQAENFLNTFLGIAAIELALVMMVNFEGLYLNVPALTIHFLSLWTAASLSSLTIFSIIKFVFGVFLLFSITGLLSLLAAFGTFGAYDTITQIIRNPRISSRLRLLLGLSIAVAIGWWLWVDAPRYMDGAVFDKDDPISNGRLTAIWYSAVVKSISFFVFYIPLLINSTVLSFMVVIESITLGSMLLKWLLSSYVLFNVAFLRDFLLTPIETHNNSLPNSLIDIHQSDLDLIQEWAQSRANSGVNQTIFTTIVLATIAIVATTDLGNNAFLYLADLLAQRGNSNASLGTIMLSQFIIAALGAAAFLIVWLLREIFVANMIIQLMVLARSAKSDHKPYQSFPRTLARFHRMRSLSRSRFRMNR